MRKRSRSKEIDQHLLDTINLLKRDWHHIQTIMEKSIEPTEESLYQQNIAQAKYLFLLREARHRNIRAQRYN